MGGGGGGELKGGLWEDFVRGRCLLRPVIGDSDRDLT